MKKAKGNKGEKPLNPNSKPFCDCSPCSCKRCPDIREAINLPDMKPLKIVPGAKKKLSKDVKSKPKSARKKIVQEVRRPSLLDVMKNDDECNCEKMARAVRSNVHKNLHIHERARTSKDIE